MTQKAIADQVMSSASHQYRLRPPAPCHGNPYRQRLKTVALPFDAAAPRLGGSADKPQSASATTFADPMPSTVLPIVTAAYRSRPELFERFRGDALPRPRLLSPYEWRYQLIRLPKRCRGWLVRCLRRCHVPGEHIYRKWLPCDLSSVIEKSQEMIPAEEPDQLEKAARTASYRQSEAYAVRRLLAKARRQAVNVRELS